METAAQLGVFRNKVPTTLRQSTSGTPCYRQIVLVAVSYPSTIDNCLLDRLIYETIEALHFRPSREETHFKNLA